MTKNAVALIAKLEKYHTRPVLLKSRWHTYDITLTTLNYEFLI